MSAETDLREKLALEVSFKRELASYFQRVLNAFEMKARNRAPMDVHAMFDDELNEILKRQYVRVEQEFGTRLRRNMPKSVSSTVEEDREINRAFTSFNRVRTVLQTQMINDTTQKNITQAMAQASSFDTETDKLEDGKVIRIKAGLVGFELVLTAKQILKKKFLNRIPSIAQTETQTPAEMSKLTEAEVLSGVQPSVLGGEPNKIPVSKTWVTILDSRTRASHVDADGQTVDANKNFIVGGYPMRVPGDSSNGAPANETINCRCAAVFDEGQIVAIRLRVGEKPFLQVGN